MNERGFTLLETMLFLAISAGLAVIALVGMSTSIRNARFSTGVRDLKENIVQEFSAAKLGENIGSRLKCTISQSGVAPGRLNLSADSSAAAGTQEDCVIVGKALSIGENVILYYNIIARRVPAGSNCEWSLNFLSCYKPLVRYAGNENVWAGNMEGLQREIYALPTDADGTYSYKNGIRVIDGRGTGLVFGYVQDPNTGERHQFFYNGNYAELTAATVLSADPVEGRNGKACLRLDNRRASLSFALNKTEPELEFGDSACN